MSAITPEQLYCFNPHTGKRDGGFCVWEGTGKCLQCQAADRIALLEKACEAANDFCIEERAGKAYQETFEFMADALRAAGYLEEPAP